MANKYEIGDVVRLSTTTVFTDIEGAAFDPDKVIFKYKPQGASTVTKTLAANPTEVIKDGTGDYHLDVPVTVAGWWYYRIEGTDAATPANPLGADEGYFEVVATNV